MPEPVVTPWEVKGNVDYDKLVHEFGVSRIDDVLLRRIRKKAGELHHFLRRSIFFAHRDLKFVLDEYDKKNKFFLYTGRAPSGPNHLGHLVPWMFTKWLQEVYDVELWFQFPDEEKYLFKENLSLDDAQTYTFENALDVIALGFKPNKTHFLIDTKHAGIMYRPAVQIAKRITYSTVKSAFGFQDSQNIGAIFYTAMQAVPAILPSIISGKPMPCLIPHAIDQDPHFRISRDVIPKLGYPKPASIQCRFLPGLGGIAEEGKMSSSIAVTSIFVTDDEKTIKTKINKYAFSGGRATVEEHRKKGGDPNVDIPYQYLTFFEPDDAKLRRIHDDYVAGKLLSGEIKAILIDALTDFLAKHQKKRERAKDMFDRYVYK